MPVSGGRPGVGGDVAVIGLGRFGGHVAESLSRLGHRVLAVDEDARLVRRWSHRLPYVLQADSTDDAALRQLGIGDFPRVVVAIGAGVEASVLTVLALAEIGVPQIWARATSTRHARILSSVGAQHVIFPEAAMGERVAHLIISNLLDFIDFGEDFAIAKTRAPDSVAGRSLAEIGLRERYGVVVVGVKSPTGPFEYAGPETVIPRDGVLVIEGTIEQVQRFAAIG
ncbi:TrkA family potassium uptake protein [Micromonospora sp. NPDC049559]|uniref:potassium channel family protein n=1 Tax=Micromonospora sp. NPDC049559 TaxID=3155923 RepID=UPI00344117A4